MPHRRSVLLFNNNFLISGTSGGLFSSRFLSLDDDGGDLISEKSFKQFEVFRRVFALKNLKTQLPSTRSSCQLLINLTQLLSSQRMQASAGPLAQSGIRNVITSTLHWAPVHKLRLWRHYKTDGWSNIKCTLAHTHIAISLVYNAITEAFDQCQLYAGASTCVNSLGSSKSV